MGTEVEYGISVPGEPGVNPVISSTQVVLAYAASVAAPRARRPRWDYEVESPLRDARGYDLSALFGAAEPDVDDIGAANVILSNGARLYVDHAHPEFSAPEVTNPLDGVLFDKAGERVMEAAARLAAALPGSKPIQMYKNNVDGKGASYGTHENYLCSRDTPFPAIISGLTPFFASRQVFAGAGRVGIGPSGQTEGFQLGQRSDYIEVEVGLETTLKRGIINTRDEPHADADKHRRLHVIIGDANLAEIATYLKLGTAALVLSMIESGWALPAVELAHPVAAVHQISHDPTLKVTVPLVDGRRFTGLDVQRAYHEAAAKYVEAEYGADVDEQTRRRAGPLDQRARPARRRSAGPGRRARLAGETAPAGRLPQPGRAVLGCAPAGPGRPAVRRRPEGQGPVQPAGLPRLDEDAGHRGAPCWQAMTEPAGGHQGLLPRPVRRQVRRPAGCRVLGFGDLRHRPGLAGPDPDHGADPGHQGPRRGAAGRRRRCRPNWWTR